MQPSQGDKSSLQLAQKDLTRDRLVAGALRVFEEKGYDDARVDAIVRAAECSRATFYLHFRTKSDVLAAALEDVQTEIEEAGAAFGRLLASGMDREAFRPLLGQILNPWVSRPGLIKAYIAACLSEPEIAQLGRQMHQSAYENMGPYLNAFSEKEQKRVRGRLEATGEMTLTAARLIMDENADLEYDDAVSFLVDFWVDTLIPPGSLDRPGKFNE